MASSVPSTSPVVTPDQLRRLSAALSASASSTVASPSLTPAQLLRKASNKAAAHRLRAARQLGQAAKASVVAAALGSGDDALLDSAVQDVASLQLAYRTRVATGAISGFNPFTGQEVDGEESRSTRSSVTSASASARVAGCQSSNGPAVDEAVLWIYENLRYRLHPQHEVHGSLVAAAVRAGDRLGVMHQEHAFMLDYRAHLEERCREFPNIRFSSVPGGKLLGGTALAALQDAVSRSADAAYWKAITRHLLGVKLLKSDSAERALLTLFEVTIPRRPDDPKGVMWYEEFLTRDLSFTRAQVQEQFAHPSSRQRALEGVVPIMLLRYAQLVEGASRYLPLDTEPPPAPAPVPTTSQARIRELEDRCRKQALALEEARSEIESIKKEKSPGGKRPATKGGKKEARGRKPAVKGPRGRGRDTHADARYSSDETEGTEFDEYSRNPDARYDSFLVPDGDGEEEYVPSGSEEELSTVSGTTGTRRKADGSVTGKSSQASRITLPSSVHALLRDPTPEHRKDLRWEFGSNRKLVSYWEHIIDYHTDPTLMDAPHVLRLVREIRSHRGLLLADLQGHLYTVRWNTTINVRKYNARQGCSPIANPDKCERIGSASAEQTLDNHMYPRCHASLMEFLLQMKDQALKPTRIKFCCSREERQGHIRHYESLLKQQLGEIFPSELPHGYHHNELYVSRWALFLSFHVKQWMHAVVQADLSALTRRFREHWQPYERAMQELARVDSGGFLLHLELLGYHCRLCGRLALVASCCDNPRCTHVKSGLAGRAAGGLGYQLVSEADYDRRLEDWQNARLAAWKAEGSRGTQPKKDKAAFTKEVKISSRPRDCASPEATGIQQFRLQQDRLPYFTWDERGGFDVVQDY